MRVDGRKATAKWELNDVASVERQRAAEQLAAIQIQSNAHVDDLAATVSQQVLLVLNWNASSHSWPRLA
jgi:hypothetical protein